MVLRWARLVVFAAVAYARIKVADECVRGVCATSTLGVQPPWAPSGFPPSELPSPSVFHPTLVPHPLTAGPRARPPDC